MSAVWQETEVGITYGTTAKTSNIGRGSRSFEEPILVLLLGHGWSTLLRDLEQKGISSGGLSSWLPAISTYA